MKDILQSLNRIVEKYNPIVMAILLIAVAFSFCSCSRKVYSENSSKTENTRVIDSVSHSFIDTVTVTKIIRDTVVEKIKEDSFTYEKDSSNTSTIVRNDTVFVTTDRWHYIYSSNSKDNSSEASHNEYSSIEEYLASFDSHNHYSSVYKNDSTVVAITKEEEPPNLKWYQKLWNWIKAPFCKIIVFVEKMIIGILLIFLFAGLWKFYLSKSDFVGKITGFITSSAKNVYNFVVEIFKRK